MAAEVEAIVSAQGATPATIAVLDGVCRVGLDAESVERLARSEDVHKATTRDLPWLMAVRIVVRPSRWTCPRT
jgi:pseudouridine-5'-phosphate glycosidase